MAKQRFSRFTRSSLVQNAIDGISKPATDSELSDLKGIVYLILFSDMSWYVGASRGTFSKRYKYGVKRCYQAPVQVHAKAQECEYSVFILRSGISDTKQLWECEIAAINECNLVDDTCLNISGGGGKADHRYKPITLKSPTGEIVAFDSYTHAGAKSGGSSQEIGCLVRGEVKSVRGWTLPDYDGLIKHEMLCKPIDIVNPDGNVVTFKSHKEAAKAIGVSTINCLANGKSTTIKGWHLPGVKKRKYLKTILVSPSGETHEFSSRLEASKHIGCCNQLISQLTTGKCESAKGWTLAK